MYWSSVASYRYGKPIASAIRRTAASDPVRKCTPFRAVGMMVLGEIVRLRGRGVFRRVARVDADRDEAEVAAGIELQPVERRHQPAQRQAAERPAVQIFENQHDRLAGEKRRERTRARLLVIEDNG